jgi:hypothetical protein
MSNDDAGLRKATALRDADRLGRRDIFATTTKKSHEERQKCVAVTVIEVYFG